MENKINRQTKNEEIDRLLEEQYYAETKILESAILKAAGKSSWEEFPEESEEEIQQGYDRLIARLKEKGEYRESLSENNDHNAFRHTIHQFLKKNKKIYFLCDICHFDSYSICNGSLRKRFLTVSRNETLYTCGS